MTHSKVSAPWRKVLVAVAATSALVLTACSGGDGSGGGNTEGTSVPYDSSPEEFAAALADMDPVTLQYNTGQSSEASPQAKPYLRLAEYIEEYSGGKINVEMIWANSVVGVTEMDNGLGDGRLDISSVLPIYEPSEYPANALLNDITLLNPGGVLEGLLVGGASIIELGHREPAFRDEFQAVGVYPALSQLTVSATYLLCSEPIESRAEFAGKQIRVSGTAHATEFEALGAVAVSMPYTEIYEALQRGVVDCTTASFATAATAGLLEVAPYAHYSPDVAIPLATGPFGYGDKVNDLPIPAQQIVFDAVYEMQKYFIINDLEVTISEAVEAINANPNGDILEFDAETVQVLTEANEEIARDLAESATFDGSTLVDDLNGYIEKWQGIYDELGYEGGSLADLNEWFDPATFDLDPFFDAIYEEVVNEYRPGA